MSIHEWLSPEWVRCEEDWVTDLRLPDVALSGKIPIGILGNLTQLRTVSLRLNSLTGQLPSDLALCWNNLSGSMSNLSSLKSLAHFNVSNNLSMLLGLIFYKGFLLNSRESDDRLLIWYLTKFGEWVMVSEASTEEDGYGEVTNTFENMWDLTSDMDLLMELLEEYTLETALVDLIDHSLQAVWLNSENHMRLIRFELT
ncbi:hypothetical protein V6N13_043206 [Hibiscus sabdariffa]|uniref:Uncharacterized protein n=1 Tax=Hibiscus sabdariffa TaxID=183260 RepID=A0ABR2G2A5_9ROSI